MASAPQLASSAGLWPALSWCPQHARTTYEQDGGDGTTGRRSRNGVWNARSRSSAIVGSGEKTPLDGRRPYFADSSGQSPNAAGKATFTAGMIDYRTWLCAAGTLRQQPRVRFTSACFYSRSGTAARYRGGDAGRSDRALRHRGCRGQVSRCTRRAFCSCRQTKYGTAAIAPAPAASSQHASSPFEW